jgi:hypothetical protein
MRRLLLLLILAPGTVVAQCGFSAGQSGFCVAPFLAITPNVANAQAGIPFTMNLTATGAAAGTVGWTLVTGTNPQNGLTMNTSSSAASVTGSSPTAGTASWQVRWTDSKGISYPGSVSVNIAAAASTTVTPISVNVNKSTTAQFAAVANFSDSTSAVVTSMATWNLPSGAGCTGSTASSSGLFTAGTTAGPCTVQATFGGNAGQGTANVTATTGNPTILNTNPLPNGQINQPYSSTNSGTNGSQGIGQGVQLTATGGTAPYTWSLHTGSTLPAGLTLSASGLVSGTPTAAAAGVSIQFDVVDAASATGSFVASSGITVASLNNALTVTLAQPSLPAGSTTIATVTGTYSDGSTAALPISQPSGVTFIQSNNTLSTTAGTTTVSTAFSSNVAAGDAIIVTTMVGGTTTSSVTDTLGNTYTKAVQTLSGGTDEIAIFYALNSTGGADTVTAHYAVANGFATVYIHEYAGVLTSAALDKTSSGTGSGTAVSSGATAATTSANELLIGMATSDHTITAGESGWNIRQNAGGNMSQDDVVSATGAYAATFTQNITGNWAAIIATFKANAVPAGAAYLSSGTLTCATTSTNQVAALPVSSPCTSVITATSGAASGTATLSVTVTNPDTTIIIVTNPAVTVQVGTPVDIYAIGNVTSQKYTVTWGISPSGGVASISPLTGTDTNVSCSAASAPNAFIINATYAGLTSGSTSATCVSNSAGIINATDCSPGAISTAWSQMSTGAYVIKVPSCAGTGTPANGLWTAGVASTLTVPAGVSSVTIQGSTAIKCTGTAGSSSYACPATDGTVIADNVAGSNPLILINTGPATQAATVRITGMTFQGGTGGAKFNGILGFSGSTSNLRVDHNHFNHFTYSPQNASSSIQLNGVIYGVADHNLFEAPQQNNHVRMYNGSGYGDAQFNQATNLGGSTFFFVEANVFNGGFVNDCLDGGKGVIRYNKLIVVGYSGAWQIHGVGQGTDYGRTCRAIEAYHNYFNNTTGSTQFAGGEVGGGVGVNWANTYTTGYSDAIAFRVLREAAASTNVHAYPTGPGYCGTGSTGTSSPIDQNLDATGYACYDEVGRGQGDLLGGAWPSSGASGPKTNVTLGTSPATWPRQKLEPWYTWLDSVQSGTVLCASLSWNGTAPVANRDFFCYNASFTGASGTGAGLASARPATCTTNTAAYPAGNSPGVGYWATDTNTLYVCTATNTWSVYYKPYPYPHPLAGP